MLGKPQGIVAPSGSQHHSFSGWGWAVLQKRLKGRGRLAQIPAGGALLVAPFPGGSAERGVGGGCGHGWLRCMLAQSFRVAPMRRRRVLTGLGLATAGGIGLSSGAQAQAQAAPELRRPPRLRPGDRVGIVSPAGATFQRDRLDLVVDAVRALGFVPKLGAHVLDRYGYLAGTDQARAADLNAMFADPTVAAILPVRGDWGSARILPYLDYDQIRANPKVIIGFSDITSLLLGIHAQTGLVTFHGPHGITPGAAIRWTFCGRCCKTAKPLPLPILCWGPIKIDSCATRAGFTPSPQAAPLAR